MDEVAVVNASPLILLSRGGHAGLLRHFAAHVIVPEPVATEVLRKGAEDAAVKILNSTPWLEILPAPPVPEAILSCGLGRGESSVLALACGHPKGVAIMDDLAARRCAATLGLPVRGTLGIVLVAKNRGLVPSARAVMEDLVRAGLYLSRPVLDAALRRVGE